MKTTLPPPPSASAPAPRRYNVTALQRCLVTTLQRFNASTLHRFVLALICLLACLTLAPAQSRHSGQSRRSDQSSVPGPTDFDRFAQFVANRNIFDPARYPHVGYVRREVPVSINHHAPAFSFVGAMAYNKGMFAFFDGNNANYRRALQVSGKVAGYTVREISLDSVKLEADGKTIDLPLGHQMQWSQGAWQPVGESQGYAGQTMSSGTGPTPNGGGSAAADASGATTAPAIPSGPQSDILKRLMQLRQQEK